MSDRFVLSKAPIPNWADKGSSSGKILRAILEEYPYVGPFKLFIDKDIEFEEIESFFSSNKWPRPENFLTISMFFKNIFNILVFYEESIEHPDFKELKEWFFRIKRTYND